MLGLTTAKSVLRWRGVSAKVASVIVCYGPSGLNAKALVCRQTGVWVWRRRLGRPT